MKNHRVPSNHRVTFHHLDDNNDPGGEGRSFLLEFPREKMPYVTIANLVSGDKIVATGVAICNPKDTPNRKLGNFIAKGRALKEYYSSVKV